MNHLMLPDALHKRIVERVVKSSHMTCDWHADIDLSGNAVNHLLLTPKWSSKVKNNIRRKYLKRLMDLVEVHMQMILLEFEQEICTAFNLIALTPKTSQAIATVNRLYDHFKEPELNMDQLLDHTDPQLVLRLELFRAYRGSNWRIDSNYEAVAGELNFLNVNPHRVLSKFPDIPERDGQEYIEPADVSRLWDASWSDAHYVFPVDLKPKAFHDQRKAYNTGVIIHQGSGLWLHNYDNGISSWPVPLKRDLCIIKEVMPYAFLDERGLKKNRLISQSAFHMKKNTISPYTK